jgi:nucleoside-diphosphate-sugar epimerase
VKTRRSLVSHNAKLHLSSGRSGTSTRCIPQHHGASEVTAHSDKRVLLSGSSGFVGRQVIAPLLSRDFEVHVASRNPIVTPRTQAHAVDLLDAGSVSRLLRRVRPTHFVHLAWYMDPPDFWESSINQTWLDASLHLFEEFVRNGGVRFVGGGTCAEYEWGADVLREGITRDNPATQYGKVKSALRLLIESLAVKYDISFAWARVFFLFGPYEHKSRFVPSIIDPLLGDKNAHCRHGDLQRDFLYSEDAGDAIAALTVSPVQGPVNIGSGVGTPLESIARTIGVAMNKSGRVNIDNIGYNAGQPRAIVADVTRLQSEVGWKAKYDLSQGLERTIDWRSLQMKLRISEDGGRWRLGDPSA